MKFFIAAIGVAALGFAGLAYASPTFWKFEWPDTDFTKHSVPFDEISEQLIRTAGNGDGIDRQGFVLRLSPKGLCVGSTQS